MYNVIIKFSGLGSFLLYKKDNSNDCNCNFALVKTKGKVEFEH